MARQIREKVRHFFGDSRINEELNSTISRMVYLEDLIHNYDNLKNKIKEERINEIYGEYLKPHDYNYFQEELKEIKTLNSEELKESRFDNLYRHIINKVFPENEFPNPEKLNEEDSLVKKEKEVNKLNSKETKKLDEIKNKLSYKLNRYREEGETRLQFFVVRDLIPEILKNKDSVQSDYLVTHKHVLKCDNCDENTKYDFTSSSGIIFDKVFIEKYAKNNYETKCENSRKKQKNNHDTSLLSIINEIKPLENEKLKEQFAPKEISFRVKSGESLLKKLFGKIAPEEENINHPDVADLYGINICVEKEEHVLQLTNKLKTYFDKYKRKGWEYQIDDERYPRKEAKLGGSYAPIHITLSMPYFEEQTGSKKFYKIEIQIADSLNKAHEVTGKHTKHKKHKAKQLNELEKIFKEKPLYKIMYEKIFPVFDYYSRIAGKKI